jgi:hypothetical protein
MKQQRRNECLKHVFNMIACVQDFIDSNPHHNGIANQERIKEAKQPSMNATSTRMQIKQTSKLEITSYISIPLDIMQTIPCGVYKRAYDVVV